MRVQLACVLVFVLGVGAAYGQQSPPVPTRTGGTCSGHTAGCLRYCEGRPGETRCRQTCEQRRTSCMQTGVYERGMASPITNVQRE